MVLDVGSIPLIRMSHMAPSDSYLSTGRLRLGSGIPFVIDNHHRYSVPSWRREHLPLAAEVNHLSQSKKCSIVTVSWYDRTLSATGRMTDHPWTVCPSSEPPLFKG